MIALDTYEKLTEAAEDKNRISGLTHNFYRHPARFSPSFASAAIKLFSKRGDLILGPYMGGGTTVIEAMISGRRVIGVDLNSLAVFITKVKTTALTKGEIEEVVSWNETYPTRFSYQDTCEKLDKVLCECDKIKNLTLPRAKFIKKIIATGLVSLDKSTLSIFSIIIFILFQVSNQNLLLLLISPREYIGLVLLKKMEFRP